MQSTSGQRARRRRSACGRRGAAQVRQQAGVDGLHRAAGAAAGPAPDGAARWRPLRHERPERPLPPRDQPQQPPQAAAGAGRAGDHHPQREAHAAGGRRLADRQRPPRPRRRRLRQPQAEEPQRHAQGQAGPLPPEPARQARRLLRPLGHRRRPGAEAAPVRPAEAHGAGAVQAVRHARAGRRAAWRTTSRAPSASSSGRGPRSGTCWTR